MFSKFKILYNRAKRVKLWTATSELLKITLSQENLKDRNITIFEEENGAFSMDIIPRKIKNIYFYSDSIIIRNVVKSNFRHNNLPKPHEFDPHGKTYKPFSTHIVVIFIPKNLPYFIWILNQARLLNPNKIVAVGKQKYLPRSFYQTFHTFCKGKESVSKSFKKCRILSCEDCQDLDILLENQYKISYESHTFFNNPNSFSLRQIDKGTLFLLNNFKTEVSKPKKIIDLACGNGILGISIIKKMHHGSTILFCDNSLQALHAADRNWKHSKLSYQSKFINSNGLDFLIKDKTILYDKNITQYDIIVCNPPFHVEGNITVEFSTSMIHQSHVILSNGGELWLVFNKTLGYLKLIKKLYKKVNIINENNNFIIIQAIK